MAVVADLSGNNPTDVEYDTISRTYAGDPNSNLTPAFVGEIVQDTTNAVLYQAVAAANTDWVKMVSKP